MHIKHSGVNAFDKVCANIERFLKAKRSNKPKTIIQILDIDDNVPEMVTFKSFWSKRINSNDTIHLRPFCDFGGTVEISQYKDKKRTGRRYPCEQVFNQLMINVTGDCFPCCMGITSDSDDSLCIGNVKYKSITDMYTTDSKVQVIRNMHRMDDLGSLNTCRACGTWSVPSNIFVRIGNKWY